MSITAIFIIILAIGIILGGICLLKKSAKKFNLTPAQLAEIKERNEELEKEDLEKDDQ